MSVKLSKNAVVTAIISAAIGLCCGTPAMAQANGAQNNCAGLPDAGLLKTTVQNVVRGGAAQNGGMGNQEWAAVVNREGIVCAIVFSGTTASDEWPGSRVIAASKASTANGLSSRDYALSTANLFASAQPGQSLYSLTTSAPPNPNAAFGNPATFGSPDDPMIGKAIGGVIVFGGGLPLYASDGRIVGGLGLSGDTSCTDHIIAWKVRHTLHLDAVPMGPSPDHNDNMILDWQNNNSPSGFGHPSCKGGTVSDAIIRNLSKDYPTGARMSASNR